MSIPYCFLAILGLVTVAWLHTASGEEVEAAAIKSLTERGGRTERGIFGDDSVREVYLNKPVFGDDDLKLVTAIKSLRQLSLQGSSITNDGLKHLAGLEGLEVLDLYRTSINVDGLSHLAALKSLNYL